MSSYACLYPSLPSRTCVCPTMIFLYRDDGCCCSTNDVYPWFQETHQLNSIPRKKCRCFPFHRQVTQTNKSNAQALTAPCLNTVKCTIIVKIKFAYLLLLEWLFLELLCSRSFSRCLSLLDDLWWCELLLLFGLSFVSAVPLVTTECPLLTPFIPFIVLISCIRTQITKFHIHRTVKTPTPKSRPTQRWKEQRRGEKKTTNCIEYNASYMLFESTRQ